MNSTLCGKRSILVCAVILLAILVGGLALINRRPHWTQLTGPTILEPDEEVGETVSSLDYMTLTLDKERYSTRARQIRGKLQNKKGMDVEYSDVPILQILQDGIWHDMKIVNYYITTGMLPVLDAGQTNPVWLDLELYGETLIPGHYRLVIWARRPGLVGGTSDFVSAEFDVVE